MTRSETILTVGTALLSFVGALTGVYVGSRLEQLNWESRFQLEQKRLILERRVALVERMTVILNKAPLIRGLQASLEAEKEMARLAVYCSSQKESKKTSTCKSSIHADTKHVEEIGREMFALNAEWAASASLAAMYFGKNTRQALQEIRSIELSATSDEQRQKIVDSMGAELNEFHP
jgi:hypothetical protein